MSKEAVGQFSTKIGSSEYWSRLNRSTLFGSLMDSKTNYQATLRTLGEKASNTIEEIYKDLSKLGTQIRFLDSSNRNALAKQMESLYDICRMSGVTAWHNSECVQGLNLSIMSPWTSSFRDDRGIERAMGIIKKFPYSGSEAVGLLQEAAKWSISSAAGWDSQKKAFLEAVEQGKGSRFLRDVAEEYQNQTNRPSYEGKCGHTVGSRSYLAYMETRVFGSSVSGFGNPDYARFLRDALRSVADQLGRDLDNAIRENDYITDDTANKLKAVVSELDHCGVSTGSLNSKIEKLAWFVGGDPSKIRNLQRALNDLGVGQSLKEDGVYGEKTKTAIERLIDKTPDFLKDPNKLRFFSVAVDAIAAVGVASILKSELDYAIKKEWRLLWNIIWDLGAECYLRPKGYDVAALLLQHSLQSSPSDLHFPESHMVTQKVIATERFKNIFSHMEEKIQEDPETYAVDGSVDIDFQGSGGDTDLYYGIGKCKLKYTCTKYLSAVRVKFSLEDKYDFDHIRTVQIDMEQSVNFEFGLGNLANDFGLLSQKTGVISPYHIYVEFYKTIELS